ncbi:MAG: chromate transporter [Anaerolineales bacterium]|nr:chromate transporter [Anaerolineales bacterium]
MNKLWTLFSIFLKVNLLTTSGPASSGLLYSEAVGNLMSHEEFIEAVGYSSVLPGSDAIQLAMFIGYRVGGIPGALVAFIGAVLPPTVIMLSLAAVLNQLRGEAWIGGFVRGLAPALAALLLITAYQLISQSGAQGWLPVLLGMASLAAIGLFKVPAALVLLAAGLVGIFLFS